MSAVEISRHFEGNASRPTITRVLNKCSFAKYIKMNKNPVLTDKPKKIRK